MLHLSRADHRQLQRGLSTLLTPFDYATLDEWRLAVNATLRALLGADMATFLLWHPGVQRGCSAEFDGDVSNAIPNRFAWLEREFGIGRRAMRSGGPTTRAELYSSHASAIYRSDYYRDFILPARAYDAIILLAAETRALAFPRQFLFDAPALVLHHDSPRGPRFGQRGLDLLGVIQPAFEAATALVLETRNQHQDLERIIDQLPGQLLLMGGDGTVLHLNAAAAAILEPDEFRAVRNAAASIANSLTREQAARDRDLTSSKVDIGTIRGRIRLRATLGPSSTGRKRSILVSLERLDGSSGDEWRHRFRLTSQEARVAELIARRRSNAEIATALTISEHTARHHTERVLAKLGAPRRTDVESILARARVSVRATQLE